MRITNRLLFAGIFFSLGSVFSLFGQGPTHPQYVQRESATQKFYTQYGTWKAGTPLFSDAASDDEEFFISRVKPRARFSNAATQVNTSLDGKRRMLWWCPVGESKWNAIPTYHFNSEVFSMWSYLDHYGNWTSPFIRQPGAFTDACHKNGVVNSVVASVPFAASISATEENHGKTMNALATGGADKFLKYLRYYGIDGVGFNSEFNFADATFKNKVNALFVDAFKKKDAAGLPNFSMAWYSLTNNSGSISGANWDSLNDGNSNWFDNGGAVSNNFFLNYNWNSSLLSSSQQKATSFAGRSSYDVFAGMDFQGRSTADWLTLKNYNVSIGIWGAHNMNMIYESRGELGSAVEKQQAAYQLKSELVFTGGTRNPVNTPAVSNFLGYGASSATQFHGISKFLNARSTLQSADLSKEPFVTYFNLGNGKFFNFKGETTFPNEWYNIGMQDFLPTWRWWLTSTFMGRAVVDVPTAGIKPEFTWEDAWFGGSCLKVSGETTGEYLHLFKTKYPLQEGDRLTVRYKLQQGNGELRLACSAEGTESQEVQARVKRISETTTGTWVEKVIVVGARTGELNLVGKTLAMIALKFEITTADFSMLLGEVSLVRTNMPTPVKPQITKSKLLATNYNGVDFKLTFKMKDLDPLKLEAPIYNEDLNTWYYKVYSQQKNEEPVLCTTTTSWAAYVVGAPYKNASDSEMRFGVSAVALDGNSESEIVWTSYVSTAQTTIVEGIEMDKPVVNPAELFSIKYKDPNHSVATKWEIFNSKTGALVQAFVNAGSITTSLPAVGQYDLTVTDDKGVVTNFRGYIQVVSSFAGAVPQILSMTANSNTSSLNVAKEAEVDFAFTSKNSDGSVSRALRLPEKAFCVKNIRSVLGLTMDKDGDKNNGLTICFWFKSIDFHHEDWGTQLVNIRNLTRTWPRSDWGYFWTSFGSMANQTTAQGPYRGFHVSDMYWNNNDAAGTFYPVNYEISPYVWYHAAIVINASQDIAVFMNGKKVSERSRAKVDMKDLQANDNLLIGGKAFKRAGFDGYIDEVRLYNKAFKTEAEVQATMNVLANPSSEANLAGYWNFESEAVNGVMNSLVNSQSVQASIVQVKTLNEGNNVYEDDTNVSFGASAPSVDGSSYQIKTVPEWKLEGASITQQPASTSEYGNVKVKYVNNGLYRATVKLTNDWGNTSRSFEFVRVGEEYKVSFSVIPSNIHPNNFKVTFANPGSTSFEPVVSGNMYPDGVTIRLTAKALSLDGQNVFSKWMINDVVNSSNSIDINLIEPLIIKADFTGGTGLEDLHSKMDVRYGPNPFVNEVNIQFVQAGKYQIEVVSLQANTISNQTISVQADGFTTVKVNGSAGMYLVNIKKDTKVMKTLKVIKK